MIAFRKTGYFGTDEQLQFEAFKDSVREYQEAEGEEKEDLLFWIKKELKSSSAFTAFKRWLIRDNGEYYPELAVLLKNN